MTEVPPRVVSTGTQSGSEWPVRQWSSVPPTPALVRLGSRFSTVIGVFTVLGSIGVAYGCGNVEREDEAKLGSLAIPFLATTSVVVGILLIFIGVGLRKERPWARPLIIGFWIFLGLVAFVRGLIEVRESLVGWFGLGWLGFLAVACFYFYRKRNVVEYYGSLSRRAR